MQIVALCFKVFAVAVQENKTENTEPDVCLVSPHQTTVKEIRKIQESER